MYKKSVFYLAQMDNFTRLSLAMTNIDLNKHNN